MVLALPEYVKPRNVALMFFNSEPDQFFPYAQIDVVQFPEGEGGEEFTVVEGDRAEVFKWFYRNHNGMIQKRLWSLTYEYWVTDWIDVGPM